MERFTFKEVMYRDLFDAFFTYLEEIERCLSTRLVCPEDLVGITYWVGKVASSKVLPEGPLVFRPFVHKYYPRVEALMDRDHVSWAASTLDLKLPDASGDFAGPFTDAESASESSW